MGFTVSWMNFHRFVRGGVVQLATYVCTYIHTYTRIYSHTRSQIVYYTRSILYWHVCVIHIWKLQLLLKYFPLRCIGRRVCACLFMCSIWVMLTFGTLFQWAIFSTVINLWNYCAIIKCVVYYENLYLVLSNVMTYCMCV